MRTFEDIDIMVLRNDIEGLMKAARDADETIREKAIKALREINPVEAKDVLKQALMDTSDKVRRAAAGVSLGEASVREKMAEQAHVVTKEDIVEMKQSMNIAGLIEAVKNPDPLIRIEAIVALSELHLGDIAALLSFVINDPDPRVQDVVQRVMMGLPARNTNTGLPRMSNRINDRTFQQPKAVVVDVPEDLIKNDKNKMRWVWIIIGTWGVGSLLLALMILILMFTGGNFGNSGQIIGVLVLGIPGIMMLWVAVKKLREGGRK